MRKRYLTPKYIRFSLKVARRALKRRQKRARITLGQRRALYRKKRVEADVLRDSWREDNRVYAPRNCCFLSNTEEVVAFVNILEKRLKGRGTTFVILKGVETFDYGAIAILLSVMFMFKVMKIPFNGDFPKNPEAKRLITESGFFEHINRPLSDKVSYSVVKDNQVVTHMDKNVDPELSLPLMEAASMTIWGEKRIDGGMHSVLMELMQNTNNHASSGEISGEKHWWLSINHDKEKRIVSFSFIDHGIGILTSLDRKPPGSRWYGLIDGAKAVLGIRSNDEFLREIMAGRIHETVTKKKYRGKGLPNIKRMVDFNRIGKLHVISNNVYADVQSEQYRLLNCDFQGTFFYWEMSENNLSKPWPTSL